MHVERQVDYFVSIFQGSAVSEGDVRSTDSTGITESLHVSGHSKQNQRCTQGQPATDTQF